VEKKKVRTCGNCIHLNQKILIEGKPTCGRKDNYGVSCPGEPVNIDVNWSEYKQLFEWDYECWEGKRPLDVLVERLKNNE